MTTLVAAAVAAMVAAQTPSGIGAVEIGRAWDLARSLAAGGGGPEATRAQVDELLERLDAAIAALQRGTTPDDARMALGLRYAAAAVRAAVDAAQDERDEMSLYLEQARHLAGQLDAMGAPPDQPRTIDEVEGELWLEVDRYAEARAAYRRAVVVRGRAANWLGLARASARLADAPTACEAYRRAATLALAAAEAAEAREYLAGCR